MSCRARRDAYIGLRARKGSARVHHTPIPFQAAQHTHTHTLRAHMSGSRGTLIARERIRQDLARLAKLYITYTRIYLSARAYMQFLI